jgi:hypothetical protein
VSLDAAVPKGNDASTDRHRLIRKKRGSGSSVGVVRCCVRILSFSVNALAQDWPAQRALGWRPSVAASIAASKSITSATMDESSVSAPERSLCEAFEAS